VRTSTPPLRARSGKTWPGCDEVSGGLGARAIGTWMVCARSAAEMPVVTPSRASIETVNAVPSGPVLRRHHRQAEAVERSSVSARQIRPRPCLAMKLIASGVTNCAAMT
jgi:hypothetical protein